ncbi:putative tryptophan N-monooxygenase [Helianthus annuus]|nr:putative tryptophan N-monooxygenase [Helianthus annuus]
MVSRIGLSRNPEVWDDPLTFNPDRHMKGNKEVMLTDHNLHTFSFSTGLRGCPGVLWGSTVTTMLLARLVQGCMSELPPNERGVVLNENLHDIAKTKPLVALANPRLPQHIYPTLHNA